MSPRPLDLAAIVATVTLAVAQLAPAARSADAGDTLTVEQAQNYLLRVDGDDGGTFGQRADQCRQLTATSVDCVVHRFNKINSLRDPAHDFSSVDVPLGTALVSVDESGQLQVATSFFQPYPVAPHLKLVPAKGQRLGTAQVRARITSTLAAHATAKVSLHLLGRHVSLDPGRPLPAATTQTRELTALTAWDLTAHLSSRQVRIARRWLRRGRRVLAQIFVRLVADVGPGNAFVTRSKPVALAR